MAFVRWIPARIFTGTSGSCRRLFSQDKSGDGDDSTQVCHHLEDVSAVQPETPIAVPAKTNKAFRTSAWKVSKIFTEEVPKVEELSFATMLRRSKLMEVSHFFNDVDYFFKVDFFLHAAWRPQGQDCRRCDIPHGRG